MAAGKIGDIIHWKGRLIAAPTDLSPSANSAFGGTELALVRDGFFMPMLKSFRIIGESMGAKTVGRRADHGTAILGGVCISAQDNDMLQKLFRNTSAGAYSGDRVLKEDSTYRASSDYFAQSFKLLAAPDSQYHPYILFYKAVGYLDLAERIAMKLDEEFGIPFAFEAGMELSGSTYRDWVAGKREDLESLLA